MGDKANLTIESKLTRFDINIHEPELQCGYVIPSRGPCWYQVVEGTTRCPMHGGVTQQIVNNTKAVRNYNLGKWQARVGKFADNDQIKSLREEVGILRLLLEQTLEKCTDSATLLLYSHKISQLVVQIEKLVTSCDRLENRMGMLLSKSAVVQLAGTYIQIITEHVKEPDILEVIGEKIMEATRLIDDPRMETKL